MATALGVLCATGILPLGPGWASRGTPGPTPSSSASNQPPRRLTSPFQGSQEDLGCCRQGMSDIDSRMPVDGAGNGVMRPVRHPMTMFILAVLVVIGIGVGVVAVTTSERVYGPSWGRFSAVFPGGVSEHRVGPSVWAYGYAPSSGYLSFGGGWTAYARLSLPTAVFSVTALDSPVRSNYALCSRRVPRADRLVP